MKEKKKIGMPRALFYYSDPFFWPAFLENLGFEIVLSPRTNNEILRQGSKLSESEECLSLKVFNGHLDYLRDKADFVFIPRIKSVKNNYFSCPKFFAIPDLVRSFFDSSKIIEPSIDFNYHSLRDIALAVGISLKKGIPTTMTAYNKAIAYRKEKERELINQATESMKLSDSKKILVIGHLYNLRDDYISLNIFSRLRKLGVEPIEIDSLAERDKEKFFHWDSADDIVAKLKKLKKGSIAGAIQISAFPCGCDSVSREFIKTELKKKDIPFLFLILDEHSGEVGFITRIEAFIDTI